MNIEDPFAVDGSEVAACRYKMLAISVCRATHISLQSALQLTVIEAYTAIGGVCYV
jgi:hypothetical protein